MVRLYHEFSPRDALHGDIFEKIDDIPPAIIGGYAAESLSHQYYRNARKDGLKAQNRLVSIMSAVDNVFFYNNYREFNALLLD